MAAPLSADQQLQAARMFGNTVREYSGWRGRGLDRARSKGWAPQGITIHHTAGGLGSRGPESYIRDILVGDPAVPDKCSVAIDPAGVVWMVSAGRANHMLFYSQRARDMAITSSWPTSGSVNARGSLQNGNSWTYGVEIIAAGAPNPAQRLAAVRWAAGLCKLHGWDGGEVFGHGEASYDRDFSDPGLDMGAFRRDVMSLVRGGAPNATKDQTVAPPPPANLPPFVIAALGTRDDRVTQAGHKLVELGFDRHYREGPGPVLGPADLANLFDWALTFGHYPEHGYVLDVLTEGAYRDLMGTGIQYLPVANAQNPGDEQAARLVKMAGIKLGVLTESWSWSRTGDRGFEWPRLIRRLQEAVGDRPDPESEDPAVCFLGPAQLRAIADRTHLFRPVD